MDSRVHDTRVREFFKKLKLAKKKYRSPELKDQHKCLTLIAAALIVGPDEVRKFEIPHRQMSGNACQLNRSMQHHLLS